MRWVAVAFSLSGGVSAAAAEACLDAAAFDAAHPEAVAGLYAQLMAERDPTVDCPLADRASIDETRDLFLTRVVAAGCAAETGAYQEIAAGLEDRLRADFVEEDFAGTQSRYPILNTCAMTTLRDLIDAGEAGE